MSNQYLVTWTIDIEADSPREAAEQALAIQRRPDSTAVVFNVSDKSTGKYTEVDLQATRVIFRKFRVGSDVVAIFPDVSEGAGAFMSYQHIGQHGACVWPHTGLVKCGPEEYGPLERELIRIGYRLRILENWPRKVRS